MNDLRFKTRLNKGELERPRNDSLATPNEAGENCGVGGPYSHAGEWDLNGDAVFNLRDYSCDDRVQTDTPKGVGPAGMFEPQDVLIAFSDGTDDDGNGYIDDIVGWDFLDDDNDPFDDVQYGHGTGEARDSTSETDNGGDAASCPNCMGIHLRVGDSFIADVNRFAQAVTYATDNGALVVQEALGTLNNSTLSRRAVDYAYRHGVVVMASAADEAAQHNNWPSTLPHTIVTNSVRNNDPIPSPDQSYLAFNGCTNFSAKITVAIPSTSCSSNAVGLAAGFAGLIYSAAMNAHDAGVLDAYPDTAKCELTNGDPCLITPNEVRQLIASGSYGGTYQADDVNFAGSPAGSGNEPSCTPIPLPNCTSPFGAGNAIRLQVDANRPSLLGGPGVSESYPARAGHDQFYGYGRANVNKAVKALVDDPAAPSAPALPPEAEIFSPEWFQQVDPADSSLNVEGEVFARGAPYKCQIFAAPGQYPNNSLTTDAPPGDYAAVGNGWCDGTTTHSGASAATLHKGTLGQIDLAALKARFPAGTDFNGAIPQPSIATGNGRPFFAPHAFTFKVVVTPTTGPARTGEDYRSAYIHHDSDLLPGFPKSIRPGGAIDISDQPTADGESSPALADLDGDNRNELIFGGADGYVHALRLDGSELPGWPVQSDPAPFFKNHTGSRAFTSGEIPNDQSTGMFLASVAVGDPDHDGIPTVFGADYEGKVYGWAPDGSQVFEEESNPAYGGKPLAPFENVRKGKLNRTGHGFFGSPVLADIDGDGEEELIAAAMDRHIYAWRTDDSDPTHPGGADEVDGYPILVVDPAKVASVDPTTHAVTYKGDADAAQQGAIIDTPAIGDISGDSRPEIVIGTNEEYEEDPASSGFNAASLGLVAQTGILDPGNTRLYVLKPEGGNDADPLPGDALAAGWPKPMALLLTELLPVVGEGVTGSPVIGPANCPSGGSGAKIGAQSAAGPAYIFNPDGSSCYGNGPDSQPITLQTDVTLSGVVDHPVLPAVGNPVFGAFGAGGQLAPALVTPAAGVVRAADLALPEYQPIGQDFLAAWDPSTGQFQPNFPVTMNDLQFLTGPSVADIDGLPGEELIAGSASQDFAAYTSAGTPVSGWPKLSTDWNVANPVIGSFGALETDGSTKQVVVMMTRSGYLNAFETDAPACSPGSWPRFHHDNANSGDYSRDATLPGKPIGLARTGTGSSFALKFDAPGDDLLCGRADHYEIVGSANPITAQNFKNATTVGGAPAPANPGSSQSFDPGASPKRYLAVRAVDEQGNVGRLAMIEINPPDEPPIDPPLIGCDLIIQGTPLGESLVGTGKAESIRGDGGDDQIKGKGGDDCLSGGEGDDKIGGNGGDDRITGDTGLDRLHGGSGDDRVRGFGGDDTINGGSGDDALGGQAGSDRIFGGKGDDKIRGGTDPDKIRGQGGSDLIRVIGGGIDVVNCGKGTDRVVADRKDKIRPNCEKVKRKGR